MKTFLQDLEEKRDGARYYNRFLAEKDQAEFFDQSAQFIEKQVNRIEELEKAEGECQKTVERMDKENDVVINAARYHYDQIQILIEDLRDKKELKFTRGGLADKLEVLGKKLKAVFP